VISDVERIEGRGRIVDAHTIDVDGKKYTVGGAMACARAPGHQEEIRGLGPA
jgi:hypothetical protein